MGIPLAAPESRAAGLVCGMAHDKRGGGSGAGGWPPPVPPLFMGGGGGGGGADGAAAAAAGAAAAAAYAGGHVRGGGGGGYGPPSGHLVRQPNGRDGGVYPDAWGSGWAAATRLSRLQVAAAAAATAIGAEGVAAMMASVAVGMAVGGTCMEVMATKGMAAAAAAWTSARGCIRPRGSDQG